MTELSRRSFLERSGLVGLAALVTGRQLAAAPSISDDRIDARFVEIADDLWPTGLRLKIATAGGFGFSEVIRELVNSRNQGCLGFADGRGQFWLPREAALFRISYAASYYGLDYLFDFEFDPRKTQHLPRKDFRPLIRAINSQKPVSADRLDNLRKWHAEDLAEQKRLNRLRDKFNSLAKPGQVFSTNKRLNPVELKEMVQDIHAQHLLRDA